MRAMGGHGIRRFGTAGRVWHTIRPRILARASQLLRPFLRFSQSSLSCPPLNNT